MSTHEYGYHDYKYKEEICWNDIQYAKKATIAKTSKRSKVKVKENNF